MLQFDTKLDIDVFVDIVYRTSYNYGDGGFLQKLTGCVHLEMEGVTRLSYAFGTTLVDTMGLITPFNFYLLGKLVTASVSN